MQHWDIVGWAYEADTHCEDCARERFGRKLDDDMTPPEDSEGNEVHPMFAGDAHDPSGEYCGDCGAEIVEPAEDDDQDQR